MDVKIVMSHYRLGRCQDWGPVNAESLVMCWKIEPHANYDFDYCLLPARNDSDHRAALKYAKDRLEEQWDEMVDNVSLKPTVSLEMVQFSKEELDGMMNI